ncbi:MAG: hypothetical protein ACRD9Y_18355, partial [Blastocatellia bacterium]
MKNNLGVTRKLRLSFFVPFIIALSLTPVLAATDYGDLSVKVEIIPGNFGGEGYAEYRATITNRSATRSHQVTLIIPGERYGAYEASIRELTRTVEVAPGATVAVSLFQPPLPMGGIGMAVEIDGQRQNDPVPLNPVSLSTSPGSYYSSGGAVHLLVSQSVNKSGALNQAGILGNQGETIENTQTGVTFHRPRTVTASSDLPAQEWSAHWLGYSRYSGVVVTSDDLRAAPAAVQDALWRYVECGGVLLVFGQWTAPQQWQARQSWIAAQSSSSDEEAEEEKPVERGEGSEKTVLAAAPDHKPGKNDLSTYFVGYGAVIVSGDVDASRINGEQWERIIGFWSDSQVDGLANHWNINAINRQFPVVEELGTPVRGLFLLMLLFVVVIGPVNYLLLARRKKKLWLWWTVPAISLAASLGVFGYAILAEGWRGYARTEVMTVLDENAHRATTVGLTAFYAPLTPSDGLRFSYDTEVLPQLPEMNRYYGSNRGGLPRAIDWTEDQHLTSGWITARVPAHFAIRKSEPRRERLNVRREAGAISVVNGLGADIRQLWWAERDGKVYSAENVQAGANASLKLTESRTRGEVAGLREVFRSNWEDQIRQYPQKPLDTLEAGCYLAVLDSSPFLEEGLRGSA